MFNDIPGYTRLESATLDAYHFFDIVEDATKLS